MKSSKKDFIAEAEELIAEAGRLLVEVQETFATGVNPDTINALFRTIHTVKGLSGLFGYKDVSDFSHAFESLLDDIRLGRVELDDEVVRFLFTCIDTLKRSVDDILNDRSCDVGPVMKEIEAFRKAQNAAREAGKTGDPLAGIDESIRKVLSEYEEHRLKTNVREGKGIYLARTVLNLADFDQGLGILTAEVKKYGELLATLPISADIPPGSIGFHLLFGSDKPRDELSGLLKAEISILREAASKPAAAAPRTPETSLKSTTTSVRVDIEKLDRILNTISELSLAKAATGRIAGEMIEQYGHTSLVIDIMKISQTFGRKIAELLEQVLEIRMVPIGQIFSRLSQVVRRYSRESGKQIDILLYGEDTEIDKYLAEEIVDPLMHIVRNAIDHGIETPAERRAAGKREGGTITLKAFQRGHHVVIEVSDDGRGIDFAAIERKARQQGLIPEGMSPDTQAILDFIFMAGFSTKTEVSEVSGRGVGMDVVRSQLASFGGFVDVETSKGAGTKFILTMPITLAIIKALFVRVGTERFAIPLTALAETLMINRQDVQTIEGKEVFNLRGELLPIVSVSRVFGLGKEEAERSFVVVIRYGEKSIGLLVDELIGQHEIVIKSLSDYFRGVPGFAGAAEVGKHEVILVLDVEAVVEEAVSRQRAVSHV